MFGLNYQAGLHRGERGFLQQLLKLDLQISCQQQGSLGKTLSELRY